MMTISSPGYFFFLFTDHFTSNAPYPRDTISCRCENEYTTRRITGAVRSFPLITTSAGMNCRTFFQLERARLERNRLIEIYFSELNVLWLVAWNNRKEFMRRQRFASISRPIGVGLSMCYPLIAARMVENEMTFLPNMRSPRVKCKGSRELTISWCR